MKKIGFACSATFFASFGFYRGTQEYGNSINHHNELAWGKHDIKRRYMYVDAIGNGFIGSFLYLNPVLLPMILYKELYRTELFLRDIEVKTSDTYYYRIL